MRIFLQIIGGIVVCLALLALCVYVGLALWFRSYFPH